MSGYGLELKESRCSSLCKEFREGDSLLSIAPNPKFYKGKLIMRFPLNSVLEHEHGGGHRIFHPLTLKLL